MKSALKAFSVCINEAKFCFWNT